MTGDDIQIVHAVMEYADGEREPLCQGDFDPAVDCYEDDGRDRYVSCHPCHREMESRGWDVRTPPDDPERRLEWTLVQSAYEGVWVFACPHCRQTCDVPDEAVLRPGPYQCVNCKRYNIIPAGLPAAV